ncbi:MAG: NAD-dependent epimerase [Pseudobacteriovorax sp.]|nr:NAD-dependent epimerase [Pseudobacteriovorax sp.]
MSEQKRRVLVTGAAGFIGFHLSKCLVEAGYSVLGIDSLNAYYDVNLKNARLQEIIDRPTFSFEQVNIAEAESVKAVFERYKPGVVVNLAAQAGVRYSLKNPHAYIDSNITGFTNILESCRFGNIEHLIYASTSSVYGANKRMPFSPHHSTEHPLTLYAASKKSNEMMAHSYSHLFGLPTTGLRFFTVYGPWGRPDMALFLFTKAILNGEAIEVFNQGNMSRDFTYVEDIVESIKRLIPLPPQVGSNWDAHKPDPSTSSAPYRLLNIGNGKPVELMDMIEILESKLGKTAKKKLMPFQLGDVQATSADISDLSELIKFMPETDLETGVGRFVDWYMTYYKI